MLSMKGYVVYYRSRISRFICRQVFEVMLYLSNLCKVRRITALTRMYSQVKKLKWRLCSVNISEFAPSSKNIIFQFVYFIVLRSFKIKLRVGH